MRTANAPPALPLRRPRGGPVRAVRLATGLVLVTYVAGHLINHALGVISIDAQEALLAILAPPWQSLPGTILLYSALVIHALLGLYALWRRQTLRMPAWELTQLTLGLTVPLLLIPHVFGTRVASALIGTDTTYHVVVAALWSSPTAMMIPATSHGIQRGRGSASTAPRNRMSQGSAATSRTSTGSRYGSR